MTIPLAKPHPKNYHGSKGRIPAQPQHDTKYIRHGQLPNIRASVVKGFVPFVSNSTPWTVACQDPNYFLRPRKFVPSLSVNWMYLALT